MIKRTLYFGNPAYLSTHLKQMVIRKPENDSNFVELAEPSRNDNIVRPSPLRTSVWSYWTILK